MTDRLVLDATAVPVRSYGRALRERWRWVVVGTLLGVLTASVYLFATPPQYTASTVVSIQPILSDPFGSSRSSSGLVDMATEVQFAGSWTTAAQAAGNLGQGWDPREMMAATEVAAEPQGTVMRVMCEDFSPDRAVACADAMAEAYLDVRRRQALALAASLTNAIDARIEELTKDVAAALRKPGKGKGAEEAAREATARAELARQEISALVAQRTSLVAIAKNAGDVITPAANARVDRSPSTVFVLAAGLAAGLFLGVIAAFVRDRYFSVMTSGEQLADLVDLPVWLPEHAKGPERWVAAAELFNYAVEGRGAVAVAASDHPAALALASYLADARPREAGTISVVPTHSAAEVLAGVRDADAAVVVLAPGARRRDVTYLVAMLHAVGRDVLGVMLADTEDGLRARSSDAAEGDELSQGDRS